MTVETAPDLEFEYVLAMELGMTHKQLMENLEPGELDHWRSFFWRRNDTRRRLEQGR